VTTKKHYMLSAILLFMKDQTYSPTKRTNYCYICNKLDTYNLYILQLKGEYYNYRNNEMILYNLEYYYNYRNKEHILYNHEYLDYIYY